MTENSAMSVAIIGGGLAGLATAAYLGRAGHRVTLFERSETLGGRGGTTEHNGYLHNFGPHALYRGSTGLEVLREFGTSFTGGTPDVAGVAIRRGRPYTLPTGARTMLATRLFGVRARVEAGRQMLALRKITGDDRRTVREWLDHEFEQPAAREYIEAIIRLATYANAPELIPVADAARQLASAGDGVLYVDVGWRQLVRGLQDAAEAAGAEIRTGARIDALLGVDRITGVRLAGGETFEADAVVLAVPPGVARELAGGSAAIAKVSESAVPAKAACLDLGLTRLPNPRRRFGLGIDVPMYMSAHSFYAKLAPEGRVLLSVAKYLPVDEPRDAARDLAELESFLDLAQPGWQAFEEHRQYLPNMVVSSALPLPGLGIAGRPASKVDDIDGLFLAGDWVGDGGWLTDGTLGSARLASAAVSGWLAKKASRSLAGVS